MYEQAHLFHSWPISKIFTANKLKKKKIILKYSKYTMNIIGVFLYYMYVYIFNKSVPVYMYI